MGKTEKVKFNDVRKIAHLCMQKGALEVKPSTIEKGQN